MFLTDLGSLRVRFFVGVERRGERAGDDGESGAGDLVDKGPDQSRRQHGVADAAGRDVEDLEGLGRHAGPV